MKATPIKDEKKPDHPIQWVQPQGSFPYKVQDGDTWAKVAHNFNVTSARYLIFFNFYVDVEGKNARRERATDQVNWYLREYVGCNISTDGGLNWAFSKSADPGIIYIPIKTYDFEGDGLVIVGSKGVGDVIGVPQYDDSNFYDTLEKALDITEWVHMGVGVSEVELPALVEGGLIAVSAVAAFLAPSVALGAGWNEALREKSRDYFFGGFSVGLVMSANGASRDYIVSHAPEWQEPPTEAVFSEKRETFRKLHNIGVELGIRQGRKFNTVDKERFFTFLLMHMDVSDRVYFSPKIPWKDWSNDKKRDYYDKASAIVKHEMLENNLQLKVE